MITPFTTVDIFSGLVESLPGCQIMWWAARAIDKKGVGHATIDLQELSKFLDRTPNTLKAYVYQCKHVGLFRAVTVTGHTATVYYTSLFKVAASKGLTDRGACSQISIRELAHLKYAATEATADVLQSQSFHARKKAKQRRSKRKRFHMDNVERVFDGISSDICRGKPKNVIHVGKRGLFVNKRYTVYGGSQATIAEKLGVSESTVRRRLSNAHRRKKNIKLCSQGKKPLRTVEKRQVYRVTDRISADKLDHAIHVADCEFATHDHASLSKLYVHEGRVFEPRCNVYYLPVEIRPRKADKRRYKKFIDALNSGLPTTA